MFDLGVKLWIQTLCEHYGIGHNPIRLALNRLFSEGFMVQSDQRGFHVAELSVKDLEELTRAGCQLNDLALRKSSSRSSQK